MLDVKIQDFLSAQHANNLYRQRQIIDAKYLNFSSNDYLSIAAEPQLQAAYREGFLHSPIGSQASAVVCGYHKEHQILEQEFAKVLEVDACMLFSSGYAANLSVVNLLCKLGAFLLIDKSVHASIYDGLKLSEANYVRYQNLEKLNALLQHSSQANVIITESVFSMSGVQAQLHNIADIAKANAAHMIVDEAHAFGIYGKNGLGSVVAHDLDQEAVPLRIIPFGKAFAAAGAIVAGKAQWIEALVQCGRSYIYSTGVSPAFSYGLLKTLEFIYKANDRREKLHGLVSYFRQKIQNSALDWANSDSPIQMLRLGCPEKALQCAAWLREQGIICLPMRHPTVTIKNTGLRIVLNYKHDYQDLDKLFADLHEYPH